MPCQRGTQFSVSELSAVVRADPGWSKETKETRAVAVATFMGESCGGFISAWNNENLAREDSRGVAQINVNAHSWGRQMELFEPHAGVAAAYRVWKEAGRSFVPWTVWKHGTYLGWLAQARVAEGQSVKEPDLYTFVDERGQAHKVLNYKGALTPSVALPPGYEGVDKAITGGVGDLTGGLGNLLGFIGNPHSWLRVAYVVLGGALVVTGLAIVARPAVESVASVTPIGKVVG